ncbi:hypothetical protein PVK06_036431 [Gossypium arboreum]|uniref:F-box domain-containing protein n=1 Tax=Gossypium arboreum TaxID=29729 RepID=A0ABR0NJH6_GOSAR|nr:hypothetical protein PVK06_036431 [Gossypium arboreum]
MKTEVSEMEERKGKGKIMCGTLDLSALPLDCITLIISFTSPRDACRLSLVSTVFNSATESDAVWESFLPSQYEALIPSSLSLSSKKQLYLSLCENPLLIEAGRKSFWLERGSGKKCYMLSPRDLTIRWSVDTSWYWRWVSIPEASLSTAGMERLISLIRCFKCSGCAGIGPYKENNQAARQVYGICDRLFSKPYSLPQAAHPGIDLTVTVLTTGFWPSYKSFDLNLPAKMVMIEDDIP